MSDMKINERGLITYFDIKKFGFYRLRKNKVGEPFDIDSKDLLSRLDSWLNGKTFQNTVPWGGKDTAFNKIYCNSYCLDEQTGDLVLVLVKSVGEENGGVKGIKFDSVIGMDSTETVTSANGINAKEVAWGQVMYYWFIPEEDKVASIKFSDSVCDINGLSKYITEWVKYRCDKYVGNISENVRETQDGTKTINVRRKLYKHEKEQSGKGGEDFYFQFKFIAKQFRKKTNGQSLADIVTKITHLVFRSSISVKIKDRRGFSKIMDKYLSAVGFSSPATDDAGKIREKKEYEVIVNDSPTLDELEEMFQLYNEEYDESVTWDNVGLKLNGRSKDTLWLDKYVVKDELFMPVKIAENDVYSANQIMHKIKNLRKGFISSIQENEIEEELKASN